MNTEAEAEVEQPVIGLFRKYCAGNKKDKPGYWEADREMMSFKHLLVMALPDTVLGVRTGVRHIWHEQEIPASRCP